MNTLGSKFLEMKDVHFTKKQRRAGFFVIWRSQSPTIYFKVLWEAITTLVVYSPSVFSYLDTTISTLKNKWSSLSDIEQDNVIAALSYLNKNGNIERRLNIKD